MEEHLVRIMPQTKIGGCMQWTIHITHDFCHTLCSIEHVIRNELNSKTFNLQEVILDSSDVLLKWCLTSSDIEEDASALLEVIVSKFITIRRFSFSKSILELYKQDQNRSTQKSKPLWGEILEQSS